MADLLFGRLARTARDSSLPRLTRRGELGASAVEYGLIVVAIAAVVALVVFSLGLATQGLFTHTCDSVTAKIPGSC